MMESHHPNGLLFLSSILVALITPLNTWNVSIDVFLYQPSFDIVQQNPLCGRDFIHEDTDNVITWNMVPVTSLFDMLKTVKRHNVDLTLAVHHPYSEADAGMPDPRRVQHVPDDDCAGRIHVHGNCFVHSIQNMSETLSAPSMLDSYIHSRFLQAVSHAIKTQHRRTRFILMSSNHELLELSTLLMTASPMTTIMALEITDTGLLTQEQNLSTIYRTSTEHAATFIVVCSGSCIQNVIKQVYDLHQNQNHDPTRKTQWLLASTDQTDDVDIMIDTENVTNFDVAAINLKPCVVQYTAQDLGEISRGIASATSKENGIKTAYAALRDRSRLKCRINSKFWGHMCDSCGLNNRTLRLGIKQSPGFIVKTIINGTVHYSGVTINLIKQMAKTLNFSYVLLEPVDNEWGRDVNGSWTGVIGDLLSGRTDVIASPLAVTEDRAAIMDFTAPYFYDVSCVVIQTPDNYDTKWLILANKFQNVVLICIFISFLCSTIFLCVLEEVHPILWSARELTGVWNRCADSLLVHFAALMANGVNEFLLPASLPGRCVMGAWWIFSMLTAAVYRADIIAFLTAPRTTLPFNTLAEMVAQDTYTWGTLGGSAYETLFKNANISQYQQVWEGIEARLVSDPSVLSVDLNVHLHKVNTGRYAFITNTLTLRNWRVKNCDLHMISDTFYPLIFAMVLPPNSSLTSMLSKEILRLRENGVIEHWYNRETSNVSCVASNYDVKKIDIIGLLSVVYAAVIGISLALVALIGEILYKKHSRLVNSHRQQTTGDTCI
ncbi:glutamate receptor 2-like [Haliotis cracherodii]|uniref:glutamate receptor 2-like n=1 Tax=Haliotis cracherodii TaxID=6455 RepID=UPI0039EC5FAE